MGAAYRQEFELNHQNAEKMLRINILKTFEEINAETIVTKWVLERPYAVSYDKWIDNAKIEFTQS